MAVAEVINWGVTPQTNVSPIPPGPDGKRPRRVGLSLQEMMASIARYRDTLSGVTGTIILEGTDPRISWNETDAAIDNRRWDMLPTGEQFRFRVVNDADNIFSNIFTVDRTGNTVDNFTLSADDLVLENDAGDNWQTWTESTGIWQLLTGTGVKTLAIDVAADQTATFFGNEVMLAPVTGVAQLNFESDTNNLLGWHDTGAAVDNRRMVMAMGGEVWNATFFNDSFSLGTEWMRVTRTLNVADTIEFTTTLLNVEGALTATGALTTTGAFTSLGINDDAPFVVLDLLAGGMRLGTAGVDFSVSHIANDRFIQYVGGSSGGDGGGLIVWGGTHPTQADDFRLRAGVNTVIDWDEDIGELDIFSGVGSKTVAINVAANQDVTLNGGSFFFDVSAEVMTIGSGAVIGPSLIVNSSATGNPSLQFHQDGSLKAFWQFLDAGEIYRLNADGPIELRGFNTPGLSVGAAGEVGISGLLQTVASDAGSAGLNLPEGDAPTVPVDGDFWVTTDDAFVRVNGVSESIIGAGAGGGGGFQGLGIWKYRTETSAPPSTGQIRFDNANISAATEFYLHETNDEGTAMTAFLELLIQDGSVLYIQDKANADNHVIIEIASSTDNGVYRTYEIESIIESGTEPGQNTDVVLITGGAPASGGVSSGSWTPTLMDNSNSDAEAQTYIGQEGRYTKIGDVVYISGKIIMLDLGTLTVGQQAKIGGLPFTAESSSGHPGVINIGFASDLNITANQSVTAEVEDGATRILLHLWDLATGTSNLLISELSADGGLDFAGFYFV